MKASYIGQLVRISGIVTRCSDVKPLMQVAVYTCEDCGFEIYQVIEKVLLQLLYLDVHIVEYGSTVMGFTCHKILDIVVSSPS